jgi:hypothetical protein
MCNMDTKFETFSLTEHEHSIYFYYMSLGTWIPGALNFFFVVGMCHPGSEIWGLVNCFLSKNRVLTDFFEKLRAWELIFCLKILVLRTQICKKNWTLECKFSRFFRFWEKWGLKNWIKLKRVFRWQTASGKLHGVFY